MTVTLANISSVEILIKILNDFEECFGLKMNLSKTKAMWIGASKHSLEKPLGLEWCSRVKTLGIHFSCDQEQVIKQNLHERLSDVQKTINLWSLRSLSLFGKVTIIKSSLIPKLLYVSSILETPRQIIKEMERMIYKFLWKGPYKVTRRFLRGDGYRKLLLLPIHVSRRFGQPWRLGANATSPVLLLLGEREFSFLLFFLLSSSFIFLSAERRL